MPTSTPTVNAVPVLVPRPPGDWHETLESLVQELVPHRVEMPAMLTRLAVNDESAVPKLSPKIVTKAPPLVGALRGACELTLGAGTAKPLVYNRGVSHPALRALRSCASALHG